MQTTRHCPLVDYHTFFMPTYEYACQKCGQNFEAFQSMRAEPFRECPKELCRLPKWGHGKVKRLFGTGAGLIFKGSGFYISEYGSVVTSEVPPGRRCDVQAAENKETGGSPFAPCEIRRLTNRKAVNSSADLPHSHWRENWRSVSPHIHGRARKLELRAASGAPRSRRQSHDNSQRGRVAAAAQPPLIGLQRRTANRTDQNHIRSQSRSRSHCCSRHSHSRNRSHRTGNNRTGNPSPIPSPTTTESRSRR